MYENYTPYENPGDELREALATIELKQQAANNELTDLYIRITDIENDFAIVQEQFNNNEEIIDNLIEQQDAALNAHNALGKQLKECKSLRTKLKSAKKQLGESSRSRSHDSSDESDDEMEDLIVQKDAAYAIFKTLGEQLGVCESLRDELNDAKIEFHDKLSKLRSESIQLEDEIDELDAEEENLRDDLGLGLKRKSKKSKKSRKSRKSKQSKKKRKHHKK